MPSDIIERLRQRIQRSIQRLEGLQFTQQQILRIVGTGPRNTAVVLEHFRTLSELQFTPAQIIQIATNQRNHPIYTPPAATVLNSNQEQLGSYPGRIPEEYLCQLSFEIMTDPVFDPRVPHIKFERGYIERVLAIKNENPFTRQPLTHEELIPDTELKDLIKTFVDENQISAKRASV
jgi:hypothetical protein